MNALDRIMVVVPCGDRFHAMRAFGIEEDEQGFFRWEEVFLTEWSSVRQAYKSEIRNALHLAEGAVGIGQYRPHNQRQDSPLLEDITG